MGLRAVVSLPLRYFTPSVYHTEAISNVSRLLSHRYHNSLLSAAPYERCSLRVKHLQ